MVRLAQVSKILNKKVLPLALVILLGKMGERMVEGEVSTTNITPRLKIPKSVSLKILILVKINVLLWLGLG